ncbi:restriction endonuclease subunit M [Micromonospora craniellae]|uniref:Restriction endonuclease subunit M n=1 Tax=Micromonospora craniellae TaxID=2294034 RepID=A0A372FRD1_9ACTN|nr:N-6 DNA methylase [Micromonospora craniellae]RFS43315.1 restriction endonuclease subunit M [Micromonospora craniellae]
MDLTDFVTPTATREQKVPTETDAGSVVHHLDEGYLVDFLTNEPVKDNGKERVRQRILRVLFHEYQVAPEDMARDFPVKVGLDGKTRNKKADIAVFAPGTDHTEANLRRVVVCKQEPKRGKNVVKLRDLDQMKTEQAELEALLGAEDFPERRYGMWTDNVDFFFIEKESGRFGATYHQRADWPLADGTVGSGQVASAQQLRRAEPEMLKVTFRRCHNYIHGNEGMPKDAAFWQFLYLLFAKMYDERAARDGSTRRFYTTMTEPYEKEGRAAIQARILDLFEDVKKQYAASGLFTDHDQITLSERALAFIVSELAPYDLGRTDIDAKGLAYQELVGTNLRGDRGQYFTPRGAVKLMIEVLDPQEDETVLDPTCGTGGFLHATLTHLHHKMQDEDGTRGLPDSPEQSERYRDRLRKYADQHLFGADFDPFLVRATSMNIMTLADTPGNVFHMDSLAFPKGHLSGVAEASKRIPLAKGNAPGVVDVLLTNPPFGADIPVSDESVLGDFREGVAKSWSRDKETGELRESANLRGALAPEQLFVQRAIEWIKPGGRLGIVLPNGILSNPGPADEGIRRFILRECWVLASIELPVETFIVDANVNILTTLLFLKRKTDKEKTAEELGNAISYPVFMAVAEKVGVDRRGNELYKRAPNGDLIMETFEETEYITISSVPRTRVVKRSRPVIDNDLPLIAEKYREFRKHHPIPGFDPRAGKGAGE